MVTSPEPLLTLADRRDVFDTYPEPIRKRAMVAEGATPGYSRHDAVFHLATAALTHICALAFAQYRRERWREPDAKVEATLTALREPNVGAYKDLFILCQAASPSGPFAKKTTSDIRVKETVRLQNATVVIQQAVDSRAEKLAPLFKKDQRRGKKADQQAGSRTWFQFWELFALYRNKVIGHPESSLWTQFADFWEVVPPLFEAAVVEALTVGGIAHVFQDFPVMELKGVKPTGRGVYVHEFRGEWQRRSRGPKIEQSRAVTDVWPHPQWQAAIGEQFVLRLPEEQSANGPSLEIYALFYDLLGRTEPPPSLLCETLKESQEGHRPAPRPMPPSKAHGVPLGADGGRAAAIRRRPIWAMVAIAASGLAALALSGAFSGAAASCRGGARGGRPSGAEVYPHRVCPHGIGVTHKDYPSGIAIESAVYPSFNNYADNPLAGFPDERAFLGARVVKPVVDPVAGYLTGRPLSVRPGDVVKLSMLVDNNALARNGAGDGAAVAFDSRAAITLPSSPSVEPRINGYLYAQNARPDLANLQAHTVVASTWLRSEGGAPISVSVIPQSGALFQLHPATTKGTVARYVRSPLAANQMAWLQDFQSYGSTGVELDPHSGLPVGNDGRFQRDGTLPLKQSDELRWYGGDRYLGFVSFQVKVSGVGAPRRLMPATLDMLSSVARDDAAGNYGAVVHVPDRSVVEVATVIANTAGPDSRRVANSTVFTAVIPKVSATRVVVDTRVTASNEKPRPPYHDHDRVTVVSSNGAPLTLGNLRAVLVQGNHVPVRPDRPRFKWDGGIPIPARFIQLFETSRGYELQIVLPPRGRLRGGWARAEKVSFLLDVSK